MTARSGWGIGLLRGSLNLLGLALATVAVAEEHPVTLTLATIDSPGLVTTYRTQPGQPFVIRLMSRTPTGRYRVRVERTNGPVETFEPSSPPQTFMAVIQVQESCRGLRDLIQEVLHAGDETETYLKTKQMMGSDDRPACSVLESSIQVADDFTQFRVPRTYVLNGSEKLKVIVHRLSADGQAVQRTWDYRIELPPGPPSGLQWARRDEEEWLVAEIIRDVGEMIVYGATRSLPDEEPQAFAIQKSARPSGREAAYHVTMRAGSTPEPLSHPLVLPDHVWSPGAYTSWAKALLERLHLKPATPTHATPSLLVALLVPRGEIIEQENQRVSRRLNEDLLDAQAHGQAALILGTLGLHEAAGDFFDTRHVLCRMTAHLAMAEALRGETPPSVDAEYAGVILSTLVGREREALERIASLRTRRAKTAAEPAWINALTLRNTGDWRILGKPTQASLLERIEYFRALRLTQGGLRALEFLRSRPAESISDWGRIALQGVFVFARDPEFAVEEGNTFAPGILASEMKELEAVFKIQGGPDEPSAIKDLLQTVPQRCIVRTSTGGLATPQVIDRGGWAAYFERHLLHAMRSVESHLDAKLGLTDDADAFRNDMKTKFGGLRLFPLLERAWALEPSLGPGSQPASPEWKCQTALDLVRSSPELVTAKNWITLDQRCWLARNEKQMVDPIFWFPQGPPNGTNYDTHERISGILHLDLAAIETALQRAPHDKVLIRWFVEQKYRNKPTPEQFTATWGPLVGYDLAATQARTKLGPAEGEPREAMKVCEANADSCLTLGASLFARGLEDEGAAALERGFNRARDRVAVSNYMDFLVDYYFDRGEADRAMAVANDVADVYSAAGLTTKARLLTRMGRYEESEAWYRKLGKRYPESGWSLLNFYIRYEHRHTDGRFRVQAAEAVKQLFPTGLERVRLDGFREDGSILGPQGFIPPQPGGVLAPLGLRAGDVVVAVDGYRVRTEEQWYCVKSFTDEPAITLVVWRDGKYRETSEKIRRTYFGPPRPPGKAPSTPATRL